MQVNKHTEEHTIRVLQQNKRNSNHTCIRAGFLAFMLSAILALVLMGGCTADASDTGTTESELGQTHTSNSAGDADSSGFVFEDTATVDVKNGEEGR